MIFSGFGGQGLMTLGKFTAELLMHDHEVTYFPSYGTEVRGGTAYCHVCVGDRPIRVANMVMLGALTKLKNLAAEKDLVALLEKKLGTDPGKREILDLNRQALKVGAAEADRLAPDGV